MNILFLSSILITLLFFMSGIDKIKNFINVSKGFVKKTNVPFFVAEIIIALVILLELIAPFIITFYAVNPSKNNLFRPYAKLSILALIVFTLIATALYHFPPYGANYYSFMSNLSTIGGLLLLYIIHKF
jgi:uncharacterized membrane protein YphA (DoxX/SURF4 family)